MKALQLMAHGSPGVFRLADLPCPVPGPDEVAVEVRACGLNRLDLWVEQGELPVPVKLPLVPGCEISGLVRARGEGVLNFDTGQRVSVQSNLFCGSCEFCLRGEESQCLNGLLIGVQRDGGFAEHVVVPARTLVPLPAEVSFEAAAALTLAGSTAMHMLAGRVQVRRGDAVLVIAGASGVGSAAIQIAAGLGARVFSIASTAAKRELAGKLGAEAVFDSTHSDWPSLVRRATGKRGVDIIVEHVGGPVLSLAFQCLARGGAIVTCGASAGRQAAFDLWPMFVKQQRLIGSYGRTRVDMIETLKWAAEGRLKPVIDQVWPLAGALDAYFRLRRGEILGKAVIML